MLKMIGVFLAMLLAGMTSAFAAVDLAPVTAAAGDAETVIAAIIGFVVLVWAGFKIVSLFKR